MVQKPHGKKDALTYNWAAHPLLFLKQKFVEEGAQQDIQKMKYNRE